MTFTIAHSVCACLCVHANDQSGNPVVSRYRRIYRDVWFNDEIFVYLSIYFFEHKTIQQLVCGRRRFPVKMQI